MDNQLLFVLSLGLRKLLNKIVINYSDKIARFLLIQHNNLLSPVSFLDRSREIDQITFTSYKKVIKFIKEKEYDPKSEQIYNLKKAWSENREYPMKIGRFINRLFKDIFTQTEIENFVNRFKVESKIDTSGLKWERLHGYDMNNFYLQNNYVKGGGTLNKSCLRKPDRNIFINFLSNNPNSVRLLTLQNNKNQLLARSLIWKLSEPSNRIFLDRIYSRFDEDVNLFIKSAKKNGWLYKSKQTFGNVPIIDGKNGELKNIRMIVENFKRKNFEGYPYMDTFQYYDIEKELLTNDDYIFNGNKSVIKLNKVNGGYTTFNDIHDGEEIDMLEF